MPIKGRFKMDFLDMYDEEESDDNFKISPMGKDATALQDISLILCDI